MKNDRLNRIIDILKNYDLYEKLIEEIGEDFKKKEKEKEIISPEKNVRFIGN